jgi:hypothetical protein
MKNTTALTLTAMFAGSALLMAAGPPDALATPTVASVPRLAAPAPQQAERYELAGSEVRVFDLAGHVRVVPGQGSHVVVLVQRGGRDADKLQIHVDQDAGTLSIDIPGDRLIYPELGRHSRSNVRVGEGGFFGEGRRIEVRGSGSGTEAWADLTVQVPAGHAETEVGLGVGKLDATDVAAALDLRSGSGDITTESIGGALAVHTGSGDVRVTGAGDALEVRTGSGDVNVRDVAGAATIGTGSGDVEISGRVGGSLTARTGSGDVTAQRVEGDRLDVRTGSGDIEIDEARAGDVSLHTGSGGIRARLQRALSALRVDTGSGDVDLAIPSSTDADLAIDTGSGEISSELPLQMTRMGRNHFRGKIGKGGPEFVIRTGSGDVSLSVARASGQGG